MNKSTTKTVKLPANLISEITALENNNPHFNSCQYTEEMDGVIVAMWGNPKILRKDATKFFKDRYGFGNSETLRKRYMKLTEEK